MGVILTTGELVRLKGSGFMGVTGVLGVVGVLLLRAVLLGGCRLRKSTAVDALEEEEGAFREEVDSKMKS